ncbi:MAG: methyltransferase domain-containing protein [Clostridia bacterium]|nr:methyltransferase domain-containing protein [Clostridia bacterium]
MVERFPIVKAGHIFNKYYKKDNKVKILKYEEIEVNYPCRLDAMAINPAAVTYNDTMVFTPGEVVISVEKYINVKIKVTNFEGGKLLISDRTKRKVLIKHAYLLMCDALNVNPSLEIDVDDKEIPKHCGFGSSSSTISAVAVAINELYENPIVLKDLIKYLASNHGEEVSDSNNDDLKVVQCIGGGATNGQTDEGVIIISGKSCTISKMNYEGEILIGIPNDFVEQDADLLMTLEEENLWKFKKTGDEYKDKIAYRFLHRVLPDMTEGNIESLADIVFDYRFNMGSIENCSFVFPRMNVIAKDIRKLYEEKHCQFLALSSVGPAFFTITNKAEDTQYCKNEMEKLNLTVIKTKICNHKYMIMNLKIIDSYWKEDDTNKLFYTRKPSKYITDEIKKILEKNSVRNAIDIGCGGGRYSKYLASKNIKTLAIDKNPEMFKYCKEENNKKIIYKYGRMSKIEENDNKFDLAISIGVIHNATNINEFKQSFKEIYRVLKSKGCAIISIFTSDIITQDLKKMKEKYLYKIEGRPSMILMEKEHIKQILSEIGFVFIKEIDEHITDVSEVGKRNVWSFTVQK